MPVTGGEALHRPAGDARQHRQGPCEDHRVVPGLPPPGRARPGRDGRAIRRRDERPGLARAARMRPVRVAAGRHGGERDPLGATGTPQGQLSTQSGHSLCPWHHSRGFYWTFPECPIRRALGRRCQIRHTQFAAISGLAGYGLLNRRGSCAHGNLRSATKSRWTVRLRKRAHGRVPGPVPGFEAPIKDRRDFLKGRFGRGRRKPAGRSRSPPRVCACVNAQTDAEPVLHSVRPLAREVTLRGVPDDRLVIRINPPHSAIAPRAS